MISSMTGFGKGAVQNGNISIEVELKSFNSRFLDISVKLPRSLSHKEFDLREKIKKKIKRGKLTVSVYFKRDENADASNMLDKEKLMNVTNLLKKIKKISKLKGKPSFDNLLALHEIYLSEAEVDEEIGQKMLDTGVKEALKKFEKMRTDEGRELESDLIGRINNISNIVDKIENNSDGIVKDYFIRLKDRAKQLVSELGEYDDRLNLELALLAEKYDITEECVRIRSHIKMFLNTLKESEEVGRKLNFISQEMNREANTISSKSISPEISHHGITIKEELEKIREQIQNIE